MPSSASSSRIAADSAASSRATATPLGLAGSLGFVPGLPTLVDCDQPADDRDGHRDRQSRQQPAEPLVGPLLLGDTFGFAFPPLVTGGPARSQELPRGFGQHLGSTPELLQGGLQLRPSIQRTGVTTQ